MITIHGLENSILLSDELSTRVLSTVAPVGTPLEFGYGDHTYRLVHMKTAQDTMRAIAGALLEPAVVQGLSTVCVAGTGYLHVLRAAANLRPEFKSVDTNEVATLMQLGLELILSSYRRQSTIRLDKPGKTGEEIHSLWL